MAVAKTGHPQGTRTGLGNLGENGRILTVGTNFPENHQIGLIEFRGSAQAFLAAAYESTAAVSIHFLGIHPAMIS